MISIIYEQRAIPVYFEFLSKLGSSNFPEQTSVISKVLPLFKNEQLLILGDREFCSVKLASWLRAQEVQFCLRLKKNEFIARENENWSELNALGLKPGNSLFIEDFKVTKTKKIGGFNVAGKWQPKILEVAPKEGWFILTNLTSKDAAMTAYKKDSALKKCSEILRAVAIIWKIQMYLVSA